MTTQADVLKAIEYVRLEVERMVAAVNALDCEKYHEHLDHFSASTAHLLGPELDNQEFHSQMTKATSMIYIFHDIKHLCRKIAEATTPADQSAMLVEKIRGCVARAYRFAGHAGKFDGYYYPHLVGGLQGVLEEIEPRLIPVFRKINHSRSWEEEVQ